ncbi:MAG: hypothetical protein FWF34_02075 [Alphaproteobacteria bacterium]|nr:hypothetical protein [Alphaproteobacteria bacterium]MCL2890019.1 hypothetical protein [Alphaproteobacteria bacterium]
MKKDGIGGANTKTGLVFEGKTDLADFLSRQKNYSLAHDKNKFLEVFYNKKSVAYIFKKHDLYRFLALRGIDWKTILSKKLLPDDSIYVIANNVLYIVEAKFQQTPGSVDEKLQTCDFKKKQYKKLLAPLNIDVEYMYLLFDWFRDPRYKDVLDYINSVRCDYYFGYIPLNKLGLPVPK